MAIGTRAGFDPGQKIGRFGKSLENPQRALKQIGALMVAESQAAFKFQDFGGEKWPPRSDVNVFGIIADFHAGKRTPPKRRFQPRPALVDTGRLAASISFQVIGSKAVEAGSNLEYAAVHQEGGAVESKPITDRVRRLLWEWLSDQDKTMRRRLGWILNKKFKGKTLKGEVPARPFVGVTDTLIEDAKQVIGVEIFEVGR